MVHRLGWRSVNVIAVFASPAALAAAMDALLARGMLDLLDIGHSALIVRDPGHEPVVVNNNVEPYEGAYSGAILGAVLLGLGAVHGGVLGLEHAAALLALVLSLAVGGLIGTAVGYAIARLTRFGFPRPMLNEIGGRLAAGQVALVVQVRPDHAAILAQALAGPEVHVEQRER